MGGERHQQTIGLKNFSSLRRQRQSTHPLGEETTNTASEIKEP